MKHALRTLLWVFLAVTLIVAAMAALIHLMEQKSSQQPNTALKTLSGDLVTLNQLAAGKPMVVNLWATWCPPCIREMPLLAKAQERYSDIHFVFINQGEQGETVTGFLRNSDLTLSNVLLDSDGQVAKVTASMALPSTLFYNAAGEQVDDAGDPLAHVHAVYAEHAQEGEQNPAQRVVDWPFTKAEIRLAVHGGNQEQVDQPADPQQAEGEQPDGAGDRLAIVETVRAEETEDPQQIAHGLGMRVLYNRRCGHQ